MWKYYDKSISTDYKVATLINSNGTEILDVYEGQDNFYTFTNYGYLNSIKIDFATIDCLYSKDNTDTTIDIQKKRLLISCKIIEQDYEKQILEIK